MHHHAEGITDEYDITMLIDDARSVGMIGRQTDDRLSALARMYVWGGQPPNFVLDRHRYCPNTGTPITAGWKA